MKNFIKKLLRESLFNEDYDPSKSRFYHGSPYPKLVWGAAPDEEIGWASEGYGIYITPDIEQAMAFSIKEGRDGYLFTLDMPSNMNIINFDGPIPESILTKVKDRPNFYKFFEVDIIPLVVDAIKNNEQDVFVGDDFQYHWDKFSSSGELPRWAIEGGIEAGKYYIYDDNFDKIVAKNLDSEKEILNYFKSLDTKVLNKEDELYLGDISNYDSEWGEITYDGITSNFNELYFYMVAHFNSLKKATLFFARLGIDGVYSTKWNETYIMNIFNANKLNIINKKIINYDDNKNRELNPDM